MIAPIANRCIQRQASSPARARGVSTATPIADAKSRKPSNVARSICNAAMTPGKYQGEQSRPTAPQRRMCDDGGDGHREGEGPKSCAEELDVDETVGQGDQPHGQAAFGPEAGGPHDSTAWNEVP